MAEINERVKVTKNVADTILAIPSFSNVGLIAKHGVSANRIATYSTLEALQAVHPSYTPVGIAGKFFFGQERKPDKIKVIYRGDAETVDVAMSAALAIDEDFYWFDTTERDDTSIKDCQSWAQTNNRLFLYSSQSPEIPTVADTDPASDAKDNSRNLVASYYKKDAGQDLVATQIAVTGTVATLTTATPHNLTVGIDANVWKTASDGLKGSWEILTVPTTTTATFEVPAGTVEDLAGGIKILSGAGFVDIGLLGLMVGTEPGRYTFDLQTIAETKADKLTDSERGFLGTKNCNYYSSIGGVACTSGLKSAGYGGKTATGRNIDLQWFIDWFATNAQFKTFQVLLQSGGELGFDKEGLQKIEASLNALCELSTSNKAITTFPVNNEIASFLRGKDYLVVMPTLDEIQQTDRANGLLKNIKIYMFYRSKIKGVEIEINLSV